MLRFHRFAHRHPQFLLTAYFAIIIAVTLLTHWGIKSPYSYGWPVLRGAPTPDEVDGHYMNPDFLFYSAPVTKFFYEPCYGDFTLATYIHHPLHSFITSVFLGLTRSFILSHYLANFTVAVLLFHAYSSLALRARVPPGAIALAGTTLLMLPYFPHYLGQPMQYIVGPGVNFLGTLAIVALELPRGAPSAANVVTSRRGAASWQVGVVMGVLSINYDSLVFLAAIALYVAFFSGRKPLQSLSAFGIAALIHMTWEALVPHLGTPTDPSTDQYQRYFSFFSGPFEAWMSFLLHPGAHPMTPWVAAQVGWGMALAHVSAYFYWFLLVGLAFYSWLFPPRLNGLWINRLFMLLCVCYFGEQFGTAAYDWENNPRRVIPLMLVFGYALTWVARRAWDAPVDVRHSRRLRWPLVGLAGLACLHSFADVFFKNPAIALAEIGQAVKAGPHYIQPLAVRLLDPATLPRLPVNHPLAIYQYPAPHIDRASWGNFVLSQGFLFLIVAALLYVMSRAKLVSRASVWVWSGFYALSLIMRFR